MVRRLTTLTLCWLWVWSVESATITAKSVSQADVADAVADAVDGDTVVIPAGEADWASPVSVLSAKSLVIRGAGQDSTVITWTGSGAYGNAPFWYTVDADHSVRFTQLGFKIYSNGTYGAICIIGAGKSTRVDRCKFTLLNGRGLRIVETAGVVDHCAFYCPEDLTAQGVSVFGVTNAWHTPHTYGTTNALYIEDCVFDYGYNNDGALDAYGGAKYVFRYNLLTNTSLGHHGLDSGGYRSTRSWEVYKNILDTEVNLVQPFRSRGGSGVCFSNTCLGTFQYQHRLDVYRADHGNSEEYLAPWGYVTGSNPFDCNDDEYGYPSLDQNGRGSFPADTPWLPVGGYTLETFEASEPIYQWSNTVNGTLWTTYVSVASVTNGPTPNDLIQPNRDYYDNVPKPGFTPLVYPHPLVTAQDGTFKHMTATTARAGTVRMR